MSRGQKVAFERLSRVAKDRACGDVQPTTVDVCAACPIRTLCYGYAQSDEFASGVWGGRVWREWLDEEVGNE